MDAWIIDKLERFAHKWQRMTGLDCFWLAKQTAILTSLVSVLFLPFSFSTEGPLFHAIMFLFSAMLAGLCGTVREQCRAAQANGCCNRLKRTIQLERIMLTLLWVVVIVGAIAGRDASFRKLITSLTLVLLLTYFISLDPLPPCESKVKQWIKGLRVKPLVTATEN